MELRKFVANIIETHGTNDPYLICRHLDIEVEYMNIKKVRGFAMLILDEPVIFLNQNLQGFSKKFVLAHELCHILRHDIPAAHFLKKNTLQKVDHLEKEANDFAALLLLDEATGSFCIDSDLDEIVARELDERKYSFKNF